MDTNFKYTMVLDCLVTRYGVYAALVFGKVWRYEQLTKKYCDAPYSRLANELGISEHTVLNMVKLLIKENLLIDISPNKFNVKHVSRRYITNQKTLQTINKGSLDEPQIPEEENGVHGMNPKCSPDEPQIPNGVQEMNPKGTNGVHQMKLKKEEESINKESIKKEKIEFYKSEIKKIYDPMPNDKYGHFIDKSKEIGIRYLEEYWNVNDEEKLKKMYEFSINYHV